MTREQEQSILEKNIKGVNITVLWTLIFCTAISVATVLSTYYSMDKRMTMLEYRVLQLEIKK